MKNLMELLGKFKLFVIFLFSLVVNIVLYNFNFGIVCFDEGVILDFFIMNLILMLFCLLIVYR